jgi:hypothetical protein
MNTKCVFRFSLQTLFEIFLILRRIERDIIINLHRPSCKVRVVVAIYLMKVEFSRYIFEKCSTNFMKIRPVGAELFHAGGRTDMTNLIVAFRKFC